MQCNVEFRVDLETFSELKPHYTFVTNKNCPPNEERTFAKINWTTTNEKAKLLPRI